MSGYTPQVGHRISLRGQIVAVQAENVLVELFSKTDQYNAWVRPDLIIERLPDPEPEWQPGDVVLDGNGATLARRSPHTEFEWRNIINDDVYRDRETIRPLTPLVRDGKPWADAVGGAQ